MRTLQCLICVLVAVMARMPMMAQSPGASEQSEFKVVELGMDYRVWSREVEVPGPAGKAVWRTNSFVELAAGMYYVNEAGALMEAVEEIKAFSGGAIAQFGQHKAIFGPNVAAPGVIDMELPDGQRMRGHVLGLGYYDSANDKSVVIAEVKDCAGKIMGANQVIYEDAFTDVLGDVRYTWRRSGVEQDVILRQKPPGPELYGLDPKTTRLEVFTEFIDCPEPVREAMAGTDAGAEERLSFGRMHLGQGRAFVEGLKSGLDVPVRKEWWKVDGRKILLESLPLQSADEALRALPEAGASATPEGASVQPRSGTAGHYASRGRKFPAVRELGTVRAHSGPMEVVAAMPLKGGLVTDWVTVIGGGSYTFKGDTTYYLSGTISFNRASIESGAVIKYTNNATLNVGTNLVLTTQAYRPAVLTSMHDNSVGEAIPGSTGTPARLNATYLAHAQSGAFDYKHLRFRYAGTGIFNYYSSNVKVWHSQFLNCGTCVELGYVPGANVVLYNVLMSQCRRDIDYEASIWVSGSHITANQMEYLHGVAYNSGYIYYTNSLARNVTNWVGAVPQSYYSPDFIPTAAAFVAGGGGDFYLRADSSYRNAGVTGINSTLLSDLRKTTTYAPVLFGVQVHTNDFALSPQVARDTDKPDLGYHYDALDYLISATYVNNATVTIEPGTMIGVYGTNLWTYGIGLCQGRAVTRGTASNPCRLVQYNVVQEGSPSGWKIPTYGLLIDGWNGGVTEMDLRFTLFSVMASDTYHIRCSMTQPLKVRDCQFGGGTIYDEAASITLQNCLLDRVHTSLFPYDENQTTLRNNLFRGGLFEYGPTESDSVVKDNVFDQAQIEDYSSEYGTYNGGYNAFVNTTGRLMPTNANDIVLGSFVYTNGPLGTFYHMSTNLVNAGSQSASLSGLYHYTVSAGQQKETNSVVDPGFHYVALNANQTPVDTDGDGLPDYLENVAGTGTYDSGAGDPSNWLESNSGISPSVKLLIFTPLQ